MSLDGAAAAISDADGKFSLEAVKPGNHKIGVQLEKFGFDTADFVINSENPVLKPINPARYELCAQIEETEGKIQLSQNGKIINTGSSGDCFMVSNGEYQLSAVSETGIYFTPASQTVVVSDSPANHVSFTRLTRPFAAFVKCIDTCEGGVANLSHSGVMWGLYRDIFFLLSCIFAF